MDGAGEYNAEGNKSEKGKYHMISLIRGTEETNKQREGGGRGLERQSRKRTLDYASQTGGHQGGAGTGEGVKERTHRHESRCSPETHPTRDVN